MSLRYGKTIPIVDPDHPLAWGRDDITGLPTMHHEMIRQMEFRGNGLAWTGFMVNYNDADQPNPQLIPPRLKPDPVPILNPRVWFFAELPNVPTGLAISTITATTVIVTWDFVSSVNAYSVQWQSNYITGSESNIEALTYTITGLTPSTQYAISVAAIGDNTSTQTIEFSTSAYSNPVYALTLTS